MDRFYFKNEVKMIEFLNSAIVYWHWIALGIILIILEMSIGTFFVMWLGLASILVGIASATIEMSFTIELSLWILLSIVTTTVWFKWFRGESISNSGQSNYKLDTLGTVFKGIEIHSRGEVKFDTPVLGNTLWHATAKSNISEGTRVRIVEINGLLIEVEPIKNKI